MNTFNFEFYPCGDQTVVRLSYDVKPHMHCAELQRMCKSFAIALGYNSATVEKYFGKDSDDDFAI